MPKFKFSHPLIKIITVISVLACAAGVEAAAKKSKKKTHVNLPNVSDSATNQISMLEDINFYGDNPAALSNTTLDFGLADNWDFAVGAYGVPIDQQINDYDISILASIEKSFIISPRFTLITGVNLGSDIVSIGTKSGIDIYSYFTGATKLWNIELNAGGYFANSWLGGFSSVGCSVNVALPINPDFTLQYGFLSGSNNLSGSTLELFYRVNKSIDFGLGMQTQYSAREEILSGVISLYYH